MILRKKEKISWGGPKFWGYHNLHSVVAAKSYQTELFRERKRERERDCYDQRYHQIYIKDTSLFCFSPTQCDCMSQQDF